MKRVKLAYVMDGFSTDVGGWAIHLFRELSHYIDVVVIAPPYEHSIERPKSVEIISPSFKIIRYKYKGKRLKRPSNLLEILTKENPSIVQSDEFFRPATLQAAEWCREFDVPHIISSRMRYRKGFIRNFVLWLMKIRARKAVKNCSCIVATQGKCSEEEFARWFKNAAYKINVLPVGIDYFNFTFWSNIPKCSTRVLLNVARVYPVKRLDLLIDVFEKVKKKYNGDIALLNVGNGQPEEIKKIKELIKEKKLEKEVYMMGPMNNLIMPINYATADILVNTSETEGISFSFLEAMCYGVPVVAFDVGGNSGVVEDNQTGNLVPFGDTEAMAERIVEILNNPKLCKKMGKNSIAKVKKEFDIKKNAKRLVRLYKEVLDGQN